MGKFLISGVDKKEDPECGVLFLFDTETKIGKTLRTGIRKGLFAWGVLIYNLGIEEGSRSNLHIYLFRKNKDELEKLKDHDRGWFKKYDPTDVFVYGGSVYFCSIKDNCIYEYSLGLGELDRHWENDTKTQINSFVMISPDDFYVSLEENEVSSIHRIREGEQELHYEDIKRPNTLAYYDYCLWYLDGKDKTLNRENEEIFVAPQTLQGLCLTKTHAYMAGHPDEDNQTGLWQVSHETQEATFFPFEEEFYAHQIVKLDTR